MTEATLSPISQIAAEFQPDRLVPGLVAGLVAGIINVVVAISLAALIFAGDLSDFVSNGIGLVLLGGIAALIVSGLLSSFPGPLRRRRTPLPPSWPWRRRLSVVCPLPPLPRRNL